jgi:ABC-type lipoprotein release transport system permease subunit
MLLVLAIRNLFRNTRRTLITVAAIAFGLGLVHMMITLQTGQYADMVRMGVSSLAGHVVVGADGYHEQQDSDLVVTGASAVGARLHEIFPDAVVAPRLMIGGLLTSARGSVGVGLAGIDPVAEAAIQDLDDKVRAGTWLSGDPGGILVGVELADSLDVEVGDKVVYMGQHGEQTEMTSRLFRVEGVFRTGGAELDGFAAFAPIAAVQEVFGTPDVANQVTLHLASPDDADSATEKVRTLLAERADLEVLHWKEAISDIWGLIQVDQVSGDISLAILGTIVAMGVLNTVLMSALERTREFGVMLSLGMKPRRLAALILLEGATIGVLGALLGALVGLGLSWPLVEYGLDYSGYFGSDTFEAAGLALSSIVKGRIDPVRMTNYTFVAIAFTTLAAAYPAWHVSRLRPVEAMHHV